MAPLSRADCSGPRPVAEVSMDDRTPARTRPEGTSASRWRTRLRTSRAWTAGLQLGAVAVIATGTVVYTVATPPAPRLLSVELAGSSAEIGRLTAGSADAYRTALAWDPALIAGYAIAIVLATLVARAVALRHVERAAYGLAAGAAVLAAACDLVENLLLRIVIDAPTPARDGVAIAAQAVSFAKWVLVVPAAAVAVVAVLLTLARALRATPEARRKAVAMAAAVEVPVREPHVHDEADSADSGAADAPLAPEDTTADDVAQRRSAWRAASRLPVGREPATDRMGFCVSGGGIRSGTFALGAMDSLRDLLVQARYLVSVSGGGYATGAMQLAMQPLQAPSTTSAGVSAARPADVFAPGSAELDHARKHGRYIADGAREWTVAVVRLLRGVLVNLLLLAALTVVTGRLIGHLFAMFPGDMLRTDTWPPAGVGWAVGSAFAAAMLLAVLRIWVEPSLGRDGHSLGVGVARVAGALFGLGCVLAVVGIGLPLLASAARRPGGVPVASGGAVSLLTAWGAAIVALGRSPAVVKSVTKAWSWQAKAGTRLRGAAANLLVTVALLLVAAALLLLLGVVLAGTGHLTGRSSTWPGHAQEWVYTASALGTLTFFATVDQVRWSLHPFYRRRLATAFSVRRVRAGMSVRAAAYDFDREMTPLHAYAGPIGDSAGKGVSPRDADFPQVIFSCAAHDTDRAVSLPGRRVVPWTMSGDYVGSPMIGWAPTRALYDYSPSVLQGDLTVQAAQAISGAAIASQLGRMARSYSHLLTLTNVRLGSWLPNPTYLRAAEPGAWMVPGLPHRRYLNTLGRELLGAHPGDAPLVYVTDGGHYENLGLVELLRHRPSLVVCIDGSGDRPDVATTFAQAIQLAYEELGVVVETGDAAQLGAGPAGPPRSASSQLIGELDDRLAQSCVLTARISYPDLGAGLPASEGLLFLGKATLTSQMPFDLLAHACRNAAFPNDSTADQWFDFAQFDAYHALGRHVGRQLRETILALADPPPVIPPQRGGPAFHLRGGDGQDLLIDLTTRAEQPAADDGIDSHA
jgi:hypothetical protein